MFKVYHKDTPMVFSSLFTKNCDIHNYETRQLNQFHVPFARTNYMLRSISVEGVRIWNMLSDRINHDCSYLSFKISLKKYIINNPDLVTYIC